MNRPSQTKKGEYIEVAWLTAAVAVHQIAIALAFRTWGETVSLWMVGLAWAAVFLAVPFVRIQSILFVFLISMPFQFYDLSFRHLGFVLSPSRILLPVVLAAWLVHRLRRRPHAGVAPLNLKLLAPLLALLVVILISVVFSVERSASVRAILSLLEQIAVLVVFVDLLRDRAIFDRVVLGAGVAAGIMGLVQASGFLRGVGTSDFTSRIILSWLRKTPIGRGPNDVAHFGALLLPLLAYQLTVRRRSLERWLLGATMAVGSVGVLLTFSRGGILAMGIGLLVSYLRRFDKRILLLLLLCAVIVAVTPFFHDAWLSKVEFATRSFNTRLGLWEVAFRAFLEYPVVGAGFGMYQYMNRHVSFTWPEQYLWPTRYLKAGGLPVNNSAHSLFTQLLAETGIGSFLAVLVFVVLLWRQLAGLGRLAASSGRTDEWWLVQHLVGLSAALLFSRMFTVGLAVYAFWVVLALLICAHPILSQRLCEKEMATAETAA